MVHNLCEKDRAEYHYPDEKRCMLSYEELNAVLKETANKDYYAMLSQANQQIHRKVVQKLERLQGKPGSFYRGSEAAGVHKGPPDLCDV